MKKLLAKIEYFVLVGAIAIFVAICYFALSSIHQLQGNARIINNIGIVRSSTQRLIKKEVCSIPDDTLIEKLDLIIEELMIGEGDNGLTLLSSNIYRDNMTLVKQQWQVLKQEIVNVRSGGDITLLFQLSEQYYDLVTETAMFAEVHTEDQAGRAMVLAVFLGVLLAILLAVSSVFFLNNIQLRKRVDELTQAAFTDFLTGMPNRASFDKFVNEMQRRAFVGQTGVCVFDMSNLKLINEKFGHSHGDRIITEFSSILKGEAGANSFLCRYSGDKFLAVFRNTDERSVQNFLSCINEKIVSHNLLHLEPLEKISFSSGYYISTLDKLSLTDMIEEADQRMYARKRQTKEVKE